jgi:hypothetical protein
MSELTNPSAGSLLCVWQSSVVFLLEHFNVVAILLIPCNKSATADSWCRQSQSSDQLITGPSATFLTCCSMLFVLISKSVLTPLHIASSSC